MIEAYGIQKFEDFLPKCAILSDPEGIANESRRERCSSFYHFSFLYIMKSASSNSSETDSIIFPETSVLEIDEAFFIKIGDFLALYFLVAYAS